MTEARLPSPTLSSHDIPVVATAIASWRTAWVALRQMPFLVCATFVLFCLLALFDEPRTAEASLELFSKDQLRAFIQVVFAAPLEIALYRFVLLRQTPRGYSVGIGGSQLLIFVGYAFALNVFLALLISLLSFLGDAPTDVAIGAAVIAVAIAVFTRTIMLFPAIAVEAPHVGMVNALRDSIGRFWKLFLVGCCTLMPIALFWLCYAGLRDLFFSDLEFFSSGSVLKDILPAVMAALVQIAQLAPLAVAAAYIYAAFADRLGRPDNLTATPLP